MHMLQSECHTQQLLAVYVAHVAGARKERKGKEMKGKEWKGKERKGKERKGKERKGKEGRIG